MRKEVLGGAMRGRLTYFLHLGSASNEIDQRRCMPREAVRGRLTFKVGGNVG